MTDSFTCPRCGRATHNERDIEEGYCGACHDWTREAPDHPFGPGCCDQDRYAHPWSEQESQEIGDWLATWPGIMMSLSFRRDQLRRLEALNAPEIILANQRRLIAEKEAELAGSLR